MPNSSLSTFFSFIKSWLQAGSFTRARSVLERARHAIEANPLLWLETIRNEANAGEERLALTRMSQVLTSILSIASFLTSYSFQALQECPHSGLLWAEAIFLEQRNKRKARSIDAIKACENDPMVTYCFALFEMLLLSSLHSFCCNIRFVGDCGMRSFVYGRQENRQSS